jgi:hypothetical protein
MNERKSNAPLRDYRFAKTPANKLMAEQFSQTDPMPPGAGSAFESSYGYGLNNPLVYTDPSGLRAKPETDAANVISEWDVIQDPAIAASSSGRCNGLNSPTEWRNRRAETG